MTTTETRTAAIAHLAADQHDDGIVYYAAETRTYYAVDWADVEDLGRRLLAGEHDAYSLWCAATSPSGEGETAEAAAEAAGWIVGCECGEWSGERCQWCGRASDTVTVEWMPEHLRSSHVAAGNSGSWPASGARRLHVSASCAEMMADHDEWVTVIRS